MSGGTSGTGGTTSTGGSSNEGDSGEGGNAGGSGGGSAGEDAASSDDAGVSSEAGSGEVSGWYEAEAIPPNELSGSTLVANPPKPRVAHCKVTCTPPVKPGDNCCSGGGEVTWLTQGIGPIPGGLTYHDVTVPSDGTYDVTWWYHCGNSDNFGDKHCGGQTDPPTTPAGCRPHQIVVNGTEMEGTYHFPCFPDSFSIIHAATTALPLKAGKNSIKVYPKERDSADMDALQISPEGKGVPPLIKSNSVVGAN
jgi:hypothetical protein